MNISMWNISTEHIIAMTFMRMLNPGLSDLLMNMVSAIVMKKHSTLPSTM